MLPIADVGRRGINARKTSAKEAMSAEEAPLVQFPRGI